MAFRTNLVIFLLSLASVGLSNVARQPLDPILNDEGCHETESSCVYDTLKGPGNIGRSCWLRCVCLGFSNGLCQQSERCHKAGKPWECKCSLKQEIHIMQGLCGYGQQDWI